MITPLNGTDVRGQYCPFYLSHRASGHSLSTIVRMFVHNKFSKDATEFGFVDNHFDISKSWVKNSIGLVSS